MLTDIEIAQQTKLRLIKDVAKDIGIAEDELEFYGKYKAKLSEELFKSLSLSQMVSLFLLQQLTQLRQVRVRQLLQQVLDKL